MTEGEFQTASRAVSPWPGLAVVAGIVAATLVLNTWTGMSPLVVALGIAAVLANVGLVKPWAEPGMKVAGRTLLGVGIVALGFRLSFASLTEIGLAGMAVVLVTVVATLLGTYALARRLGISPPLSLLMAAGFAICGQSAIAAIAPLSGADEEEVGYAVGMVALFGALAVAVLPVLDRALLHLPATTFGAWAGAGVHDTSQVIATASLAGGAALATATVVKLGRVLLLGPLLVAVGIRAGRGRRVGIENVVPWFVAGFLVAVAIRSAGVLPVPVLDGIQVAETLFLAAAMAGLGASIRLARLRSLGGRPLVVGALAWVVVATVSLVMVRLAGL